MSSKCRGVSKKQGATVKHKFTPSEDLRLQELVARNGTNNWKAVARYMPNRTSRQCRERWKYYLSTASTNSDVWTPEEDNLLLEKYSELGPRWATLMLYFRNKTDINLKNRFHRLERCKYRQANSEPSNPSTSEDEAKSSRSLIELPSPICMLPITV